MTGQERVGPLRGDSRAGAGGVRRGREGGTGAGEEELGTGLGDEYGLGAALGPAVEESGVSNGLGVAAPPPFVPGRAAELARPGPAEGPRMREAAQCGSMCAATLKGKRAGSAPFFPPPLAHVRRILCLLSRDTVIHSRKRTGLHGSLGESGGLYRLLRKNCFVPT